MDPSEYREAVYETFANPTADVEEKVDDALAAGGRYLDLPIGFFTHIEDGTQEIVQAYGDHESIQPGETCPLEDAYCRRTLETGGLLAVKDATASPAVSQSAYDTFQLGTYIGARVTVDDETYGTICFADRDQREDSFSESEEMFVELLAELVGQALERRDYERELRRRNRRLEAEKRRFEGIAETSFDILFRLGRDGRFTYVSAAVERILGYDPATLVGSPFAEFVTEESVSRVMEAYERVLDGDPVENLEMDFLSADDERVVVEVNATPIVEGGDVIGVQGVGRDVTARKERERELRIKTRAMDEADIGISISDHGHPDEPLVYVNEGFERVTGYDEASAVGRNCRFLQGEETAPEAVAALGSHVADEESVTVEILNYRASGTPFWNQVRISPVEDESGTVTHFLGFQVDVTERKRTEKLVNLLNRVLRHNLRNDMTTLLGFGSMLEDAEGDVAEFGARVVETAEDLVELSETARELERYARLDREPVRLDPGAVVRDVAAEHRDRFPSATVDVSVGTDREVVAGEELTEALSELVENAIDHNPSADPRVGVEARDDGDWVELTVTDDGPGLDEMEQSVIAKGQETDLEHASGLGLWLVNWIATRYGGSFQVRDRTDGMAGTVATVRLQGVDPGDSTDETDVRPTVLFR